MTLRILDIEGGSTRSDCVWYCLWKRLSNCRKTDGKAVLIVSVGISLVSSRARKLSAWKVRLLHSADDPETSVAISDAIKRFFVVTSHD
jgi:hypothetical protein